MEAEDEIIVEHYTSNVLGDLSDRIVRLPPLSELLRFVQTDQYSSGSYHREGPYLELLDGDDDDDDCETEEESQGEQPLGFSRLIDDNLSQAMSGLVVEGQQISSIAVQERDQGQQTIDLERSYTDSDDEFLRLLRRAREVRSALNAYQTSMSHEIMDLQTSDEDPNDIDGLENEHQGFFCANGCTIDRCADCAEQSLSTGNSNRSALDPNGFMRPLASPFRRFSSRTWRPKLLYPSGYRLQHHSVCVGR